MIICKTRKWGSSMGLLIPKQEVVNLGLKEDQEVVVEITKKENPLKELFGFGKGRKITKRQIRENRKLLESKWM